MIIERNLFGHGGINGVLRLNGRQCEGVQTLNHGSDRMRCKIAMRCLLLVAFGFYLAGCVSDTGMDFSTGSLGSDEQDLYDEIYAARKLMDADEYAAAIPRLVGTISKDPAADAAIDARFFLGVCYFEINGYGKADELLRTYLAIAPQGDYAVESEAYLQRVHRAYHAQYPTEEETHARIELLRAALEKGAETIEDCTELAGLLWERGDYEEAAELLAGVLDDDPTFGDDDRFRRRVEVSPEGEYILLTPEEIRRRQLENLPLAILNESAFRAGRDRRTQKARSYVVTGQVLNRHDSVVRGVEVNVTLYGFGSRVYDTTTENIGDLRPGEQRAFSVSFSNFENIENVDRYECIATFIR
jgi:tetratricopeptide (TPR) repeat protein